MQDISQLHTIFARTKEDIGTFRNMIQPFIDHATDEHTKLYYHHISEEEEQRLDRLEQLLPYLEKLLSEHDDLGHLSDRELSRLLSDLNLERFGLHNFREHLELALYEFKDEESRQLLDRMRAITHQDYLTTKEMMAQMSEAFSDVVPTKKVADHDEGHDIHQVDHLKASATSHTPQAVQTHEQTLSATPQKKQLTVGSLRNNR